MPYRFERCFSLGEEDRKGGSKGPKEIPLTRQLEHQASLRLEVVEVGRECLGGEQGGARLGPPAELRGASPGGNHVNEIVAGP